MKRLLQFLSAATVTAVVLTPLVTGTAFAASASLYLAPSATSVTNGNNVTVYVHESVSGDTTNAVQANFSYPSNLLQYVSTSEGSAFQVAAQTSVSGGTAQIARASYSGVSGDNVVIGVQFKAIATGTATLSFTGGSAVVSSTSNQAITPLSTPGTSITINAPAPAPSPSPKPSPKPSPTPTPTPTKDTTPPTITAVSAQNVTTSSVTITWTTSEPATSEVDYGLTNTYGLTSTSGTLVTSHTVTLNSALIVSGTTYHFVVKSADAAGNVATSTDNTFATKGVSLQVTVLDEKTGKPVANATVSYGSQSVTTNSQGQATLTNLPSTKIVVTVKVGDKTSSQTVQVANDNGKLQNASFKVAVPPSQVSWTLIAIPILIIVVGAAAFAIFRARMGGSLGNNGSGAGGSPVVITSDNYSDTAPSSTVISPSNPPAPNPVNPPDNNHLIQ